MRAEKGFTSFILNEDMNEIIKIIRRFRCINWWNYWNNIKLEKKTGGFLGSLLASLAASLIQPMISSVVKRISGRGVRRAGRGYMDKIF